MRNFFAILLIICFIFSFTGCKKEKAETKTEAKQKVTINLADDDSVNGYRTKNPEIDDTEISGDNITVGTPDTDKNTDTDNTTQTIQYCGNLNSKVFHKSSCSSVKKMKDDNKYFTSDRSSLTEQGFTPCKSCNP